MQEICHRASFLPADKRNSLSEAVMGWRRATAPRVQPGMNTPSASLLLPSKGHRHSGLSLRKKTEINHELRRQKEERTQCLKQVRKRALQFFAA